MCVFSHAACDSYWGCVVVQVEVLDESQRMIPDCQRRLEIAHSELQQLIVCYPSPQYSDSEGFCVFNMCAGWC